jgi:hypothetical protein
MEPLGSDEIRSRALLRALGCLSDNNEDSLRLHQFIPGREYLSPDAELAYRAPDNSPRAIAQQRFSEEYLCILCREWNIAEAFTDPGWFKWDASLRRRQYAGYGLYELRQLRERRCDFCRFLLVIIQHRCQSISAANADNIYVELQPYLYVDMRATALQKTARRIYTDRILVTVLERMADGTIQKLRTAAIQVAYSRTNIPEFEENVLFRGVRMNELLNPVLAQNWIELCEKHRLCQHTKSQSSHPLRFIDVTERKLVIGTMENKFAALSYVWGGPSVPQLRLTRDTYQRLTTAGGLSDSCTDLPTTIKDALTLCGQLSIQYLWVDSLCPAG